MPGLRIERELEYLVAAERGDENESVALVGADRVSGRHILLRNQFPDGRGERLAEFFEGIKGRRPNTERELQEWFASLEGKAATLFKVTSLSRWGDRARS